MDPDNPVIRLCADGMTAEMAGRTTEARELFERAWATATDDYERCVSAHYVARHQGSAEQTLHWNQVCLRYANLAGDERVAGFYPSLYLNIGHSYEQLGDRERAEEGYRAAEEHLAVLPEGPYGDMVRDGVARGLERLRK